MGEDIEPSLLVMRDAALEGDRTTLMQLSAQLAARLLVSEVGIDGYGPWLRFDASGASQRMRYIWPGRFVMGSPETEAGRYDDEVPHPVVLTRGFWLGEVAVTQALYEAVMADNPSHFRGADLPVEQVSWHDCQTFCGTLAAMFPALHLRLPSEAEWEYAARGGTTTATYNGDLDIDEDGCAPQLQDIAWYVHNSDEQSHPVGRKRANGWGLHDMLGNVYEWCEDTCAYDAQRNLCAPYAPTAQRDPRGTGGQERILRGGSWFYEARFARAAYRIAVSPDHRSELFGVRLACATTVSI